jgi:peptidoglycan/xylan/chitin deacetylase (PgdA/CDA1 family)
MTEASSGNRVYSRLFRPPYGRITRKQVAALKDHRIIMWDVLTNDYARNLTPEACLRGSIAATRPGSVVVFHDSLKAEKNMSFVLPRFLDHFAALGYSFSALP